MLEERRDFELGKETALKKRKRDEELRNAGLQHRRNVAMAIREGRLFEIGGPSAVLSPDGSVDLDGISDFMFSSG
jgi:hypothetical protein